MCRGLGMWQRWIFSTIRRHGKPMSFEDIGAAALRETGAPPDAKLNPSPARSMRRALHGLVKSGSLVAIGTGGRAEPHRYFLSFITLALTCGDDYEAIIAGLDGRDVTAIGEAIQRQMTARAQPTIASATKAA